MQLRALHIRTVALADVDDGKVMPRTEKNLGEGRNSRAKARRDVRFARPAMGRTWGGISGLRKSQRRLPGYPRYPRARCDRARRCSSMRFACRPARRLRG